MKKNFTYFVKAFMNLDMYSDHDQILILSIIASEPLMRETAVATTLELLQKFRKTNQHHLIEKLCQVTGFKIYHSIYKQETVHVFQKSYKEVALKLLTDYKKYQDVPHQLPEYLVDSFQNEIYQGISLKKLLNVITRIHYKSQCLPLLLSELTDAYDQCMTGFFTRIINSVLPLVNYSIKSSEYEKEKLYHLFTQCLESSACTDPYEMLPILSKFASTLKDIDLDLILAVLESYTGVFWGYVDSKFIFIFK